MHCAMGPTTVRAKPDSISLLAREWAQEQLFWVRCGVHRGKPCSPANLTPPDRVRAWSMQSGPVSRPPQTLPETLLVRPVDPCQTLEASQQEAGLTLGRTLAKLRPLQASLARQT